MLMSCKRFNWVLLSSKGHGRFEQNPVRTPRFLLISCQLTINNHSIIIGVLVVAVIEVLVLLSKYIVTQLNK